MTELLGLPYSPWSEKARWALDARRVPYRARTYAPLLGEPMLRVKLRKWSGPVTVPVLTDDDGRAIGESADIARWADGRGDGPALFPPELAHRVNDFVALSERGLAAGRGLSLARMLEDEEALGEMVPRALRKRLGRASTRIAAMGIRRTLRKYGAAAKDRASLERELASVLDELRAVLARAPEGKPKTLLGRFTFADVAMAQVLAFVDPPPFGLRIAPASRRAFTDPGMRERYADLLAWRDALYEAHRPKAR
ncbi:MAG TPA: glutathione S-transferase [Polyangiaceae bacterium]